MVFVGVAFALTTAELEPRANKWQASVCTASLLKSSESSANNQKIAVCFALARAAEDKTNIASLQAAVTKLETNQTAQPTSFTFFSGEPFTGAVNSPVFDAEHYTTVTVSADSRCVNSEPVLEVSDDQSHWIMQHSVPGGVMTLPVGGRYYRVSALSGGCVSQPAEVTLLAHFTN